MRKVLVTGGAGFIGSHIVDELLNREIETWVIDDLSSGNLQNSFKKTNSKFLHFYNADISNINNIVDLKDIDIVFHQAAIASVSKSVLDPISVFKTNVASSLEVLEFCRKMDVKRIVFASSSSVYGNTNNGKLSEDMPCDPVSPYGASKLAIEKYIYSYWKTYGIQSVSLRYFNVYGPRQSNNEYSGVITIFINNIINNLPIVIHGDGKQVRDFVNIRDVVKANMLAAESSKAVGQSINVGTGNATSILDIINNLSNTTGLKEIKSSFGKERIGDIRSSISDIAKAQNLLNYNPSIKIEDGLKELFNYYNVKPEINSLM